MSCSRLSKRIPTSHRYYLGIDDGYFSLRLKRCGLTHYTSLVGIVTRGTTPISIISSLIRVDALDATSKALEIVEKALALYPIKAVFLDGVTYAGFNIVDPFKLNKLTGANIIVVFRHPLDLGKVLRALRTHFPDWKYRYSVIARAYSLSLPIDFGDTSVRVTCIGLRIDLCREVVLSVTIWKPNPEPLRIADLVSSAIGRKIFELTALRMHGDEYTPFPRRRDEESGQG